MSVPDISAEIAAFRDAAYGEDVRSALISLANKLRGVITSELNDMSTTWNNYKDSVNNVISDLNTTWTNYQSGLNTAWSNYQSGLNTAWSNYQSSLNTAWSNYQTNVNNIVNPLNDRINSIDLFKSYNSVAHIEGDVSSLHKCQIMDSDGYSIGDLCEMAKNPIDLPNTPYDNFSISDEDGNIVVEFDKGRVNTLSGKTISFVGDSITTFSGYIPSGYAAFYPKNYLDDVNDTWWCKLLKQTNMRLIANCAWSGSRVSGDGASTTSASAACSNKRVQDVAGDNNEAPDFIVILISVNDFNGNVPIGTWSYNKSVPEDGTMTNLTDAYMLMLDKLHKAYPLAHIFCCTIVPHLRAVGDSYPTMHPDGTVCEAEWNQRIRDIALAMNCSVIDFAAFSGITAWNQASYMGDSKLHPNIAGANIMANIARNALERYNEQLN